MEGLTLETQDIHELLAINVVGVLINTIVYIVLGFIALGDPSPTCDQVKVWLFGIDAE